MYFGQSKFFPDAEMAERAQRDARQAVASASRDFGITLDGSVPGIKDIDKILDQLRHSVFASEFTVDLVALPNMMI